MFSLRAVSVVFAGICLHLTYGIIFTWGNFSRYLISYMHNQGQSTTTDDSTWGFALGIIGLGSIMWSGSILERRFGPRIPCIISGVIMTTAMFMTYFVCKWFIPTIIVYSFVVAFGSGLAYSTPLSVAMRWLPHYKGLVNGCVVAGYGGSAFIFNQIQTAYVNPDNYKLKDGEDYYPESVTDRVPTTFLIVGACFAVLQIIGCLLIDDPPHVKNHSLVLSESLNTVELGTPISPTTTTPLPRHYEGYSFQQSIRKLFFYVFFLMFLFNGFTTTLVSSYYKNQGEEYVTNNDSFLSWVGSFSALSNALGRILWGIVNDRIGAKKAHLYMSALGALGGFSFYYIRVNWLYAIDVCVLYFCIGGMNCIFPTGTANYFGQANFGTIYGCIYASQMISSCVCSFGASGLHTIIGNEGLFLIVGAGMAISFILNATLFHPVSWRDDSSFYCPPTTHHKKNPSSSYTNPDQIDVPSAGSGVFGEPLSKKGTVGRTSLLTQNAKKQAPLGGKLTTQKSTNLDQKSKTGLTTQKSTNLDKTPRLKTQTSTNLDKTPSLTTQKSTNLDKTPSLKTQKSTILDKTPSLTTQKSTKLDKTPSLTTQRSTNLDKTPSLTTQKSKAGLTTQKSTNLDQKPKLPETSPQPTITFPSLESTDPPITPPTGSVSPPFLHFPNE